MGALDRPENVGAFQGLQQRLQTLQSDARYAFVFGQRLTVRDELTAIIAQLLRIPVDGKPITILDVSGIPSEVLNVVVSVLCRLTFDFALWSDSPVPVTIVCEEAHRYALLYWRLVGGERGLAGRAGRRALAPRRAPRGLSRRTGPRLSAGPAVRAQFKRLIARRDVLRRRRAGHILRRSPNTPPPHN